MANWPAVWQHPAELGCYYRDKICLQMDRWINTIYSEPTGYAVVGGNKTPEGIIVSSCCPWFSITSSEFPSSGHAVFRCHPMLGEGWRQGATEGRPWREIRARSLFVWFNITLVYPWTDAKTFKFRAKEQAMATYEFSKGQAGCKSCNTYKCTSSHTHYTHTR